jgi:8-oxo-dGTP pyrophosphatase MutT (NUDIX family)
MIRKSTAIIIKDKKLLLVTTSDESFYWTPGGKIEEGESSEEALIRELKEELKIEVASTRPYFKYSSVIEEDNKPREVDCFFVEYTGELTCSSEISSMIWVSKDDISNNKIVLQNGVKLHLVPKLLADNLL